MATAKAAPKKIHPLRIGAAFVVGVGAHALWRFRHRSEAKEKEEGAFWHWHWNSPQSGAMIVGGDTLIDAELKKALSDNDRAALRKWFEDRPTTINDPIYKKLSALELVTRGGKLDLMEELLNLGADPNTDAGAGAPLETAAHFHDAAAMRLLLDHGASATFTSSPTQASPLQRIIGMGNAYALREILVHAREKGSLPALLGHVDCDGDGLVSWACLKRHSIGCLLLLLEFGASPTATSPRYGTTPLHWATINRNPQAIALLFAHGVCDKGEHVAVHLVNRATVEARDDPEELICVHQMKHLFIMHRIRTETTPKA